MFTVTDLQACEPDALPHDAGVTVVLDDDLDSMGFNRATVSAPTRDALIEYVLKHWGDEDGDWFREHVLGRIKPAEMTFRLSDGRTVEVPAAIIATFRGLDAEGHLVICHPDMPTHPETGDEYLYGLTACCHASATGTEYGLACRACYAECSDSLGGPATLAAHVVETPLERAYRLDEGCGGLDAAAVKTLIETSRENAALVEEV